MTLCLFSYQFPTVKIIAVLIPSGTSVEAVPYPTVYLTSTAFILFDKVGKVPSTANPILAGFETSSKI